MKVWMSHELVIEMKGRDRRVFIGQLSYIGGKDKHAGGKEKTRKGLSKLTS
jgi:hypothetical protein